MHFLERRFALLQNSGFLLGLLLAIFYANYQIMTGDQEQMLLKGYLGAYQDTWLAYGNAASTVGNVPGSLSAWIVGGPLLIWDNPWAPMLLLIGLRVLSYLMLDAVIKQVFSQQVRLFFMVAYWLNPWLLYDSQLYNPAYLCFFAALHFWSAFKLRDKPDFIFSFLHVLAIGGAMQFHYSWPILAVISCYLLYRKMSQPNWWGVVVAGSVILASLVPYFQEYANNEAISRESDRYIGYGLVHVYPVLKAILYWLRYASTLFSNRIITDTTFDWLTTTGWLQMVFQYLWQATLYLVGAATVVIAAKINWRAWKTVKPLIKRNIAIPDTTHWLLLYAAATVLAIIINAMLAPITFSYWHLIMTFPIALIPILVAVDRWQQDNADKFTKLLLGLTAFFLVVNLIAACDSEKYSHKVNYAEQVDIYLQKEGLHR
ncbi:3-deoxy-D-manno-octulosonic acid transferase [Enterovibrio sp. ZSDZ35]|uniref:3-deoxy-D-manno-octulosonic acid transferase n=1 Tax=Enterovibrio qingdaonensis TaxID=2899818 RepID=A0ABT5QP35_9GAMM|nr:3-deoxy-D-manno-octulosonic acid transferase [Enterovibrio sp. ZSDZ35]MDD1782056.1 3-deoxy-D-manno-octulosonic acid transferase [Enterovibrio sp. ZSDZ35]